MKWTSEQEKIINSRGKNIIVSAGAGSGKTAVLIERIFQLVKKDQVHLKEILMITFTKKAAGEMKERLREKLEESLKEEEDAFLRKELKSMGTCHISTIHSFAQSCIRDNFNYLDMDLDVAILEDGDREAYLNRGLEEVLEKAYEKGNPLFLELVATYGDLKGDEGLRKSILALHEMSRSHPDPFKWLVGGTESYVGESAAFLMTPLGKALAKNLEWSLGKCGKYLNAYGDLGIYEEVVADDAGFLEHLSYLLKKGAVSDFLEQLSIHKYMTKPRLKAGEENPLDALFQKERNNLKKQLKEIGFSLEDGLADLVDVRDATDYLLQLTMEFSDVYEGIKRENKALDYNDLELLALTVLRDEGISKEYKDYFKYVFVDEFQDTNLVQEEIFSHLSSGDNLFFVGDVKQSIYRFRLADPTIFLEKMKDYEEDEGSECILLNRNFRCVKPIITGLNELFGQMMDGFFSPVNYRRDGVLSVGSPLEEERKIQVKVFLKNSEEGHLSSQETLYMEAVACAEEIRKLIDGETYIDDVKKGRRLIQYEDISILMYSIKGAMPIYKEVFNAYGIPLYGEVDTGFLESKAVAYFLNLLSLVNNLNDDLSLFNVLKSPIFSFSLEELGQIRACYKDGSFKEALLNYEGDVEGKIHYFLEKLEDYQEKAYRGSLVDLMTYIMEDSYFYYLLSGQPNGEQEKANLRELLYLAESYEAKFTDHLKGFLAYFEFLKEKEMNLKEGTVLAEGANVVNMLTIHQSKGLEYPIVFLGGMGRQFINRRESSINMSSQLGVGAVLKEDTLRVKTLAYEVINGAEKQKSVEDNLNLLYVAMTRGKNYLYLLGSVKSMSEFEGKDPYRGLYEGKCFYDYLLPFIQESYNFDLSIEEGTLYTAEDIERLGKIPQVKNQLDKGSMGEALEVVNVPRKISVTDLKKNGLDDALKKQFLSGELTHRPAFMEEEDMNAADVGTLFHLVLENMDFQKVVDREGVDFFIEELLERGVISEVEKRIIDKDGILGFIESPLGERVRESKRIYKELGFNYLISPKVFEDGYEGLEETLLQGVVDLLFKEGDDYVLVDFKTDHQVDPRKYDSQLYWYKKAVEAISGGKIKETYLYFSTPRKLIKVD